MTFRDLTQDEINALVGTRHAATGLEFPPVGLQPYYNWLINSLHRLADAAFADFRVVRSDDADTAVFVTPGRALIFGVTLTHEGQTIDLAPYNNNTAILWLHDQEGVATLGHDTLATSWPAYPHIPLAQIELASGVITSIEDLRPQSALTVGAHLRRIDAIDNLTQSISMSPTQSQVQILQDTLNQLIDGLRQSGLLTP